MSTQSKPEPTPLQKYHHYIGVGGDSDDWPERRPEPEAEDVDWRDLKEDPPLRPIATINRYQQSERV